MTSYQAAPKVAPTTISYKVSDIPTSIEVKKTPDQSTFFNHKENAFIVRDSLYKILPFLAKSKYNRIKFDGVENELIELSISSPNCPVDSLFSIAHEFILKNFSIKKREQFLSTEVVHLKATNDKLLKDTNTIIQSGAIRGYEVPYQTTNIKMDNYTVKEMMEMVEQLYFPAIFTFDTKLTGKYDWNFQVLEIINGTETALPIEKVGEILKKEYNIDVIRRSEKISFSVYYK